jgi:hypothetical protein
MVAVENIIAAKGYPGKTMVGELAGTIAWYVIQHSQKIKQYFPIIKRAGEQGEIPKDLVAMMEDRLLVEERKPQLYGTQWISWLKHDATTGKTKPVTYIWPIADPENVNPRRYAMGFEIGILEYSEQLHAFYDKTLTVERLEKMTNERRQP